MLEETGMQPDEKGLSAHHLVLIFLACVAVCAVFFSAGFLVGYNERLSKVAPHTERISSPSAIPPVVNPPPSASSEAAPPAGNAKPANPADSGSNSAVSEEPLTASTAEPEAGGLPHVTPRATTQRPGARAITQSLDAAGSAPPARSPDGGRQEAGYNIQVVASGSKQDAEKIVKLLGARGYSAFLVSPGDTQSNDGFYHVLVGTFTSLDRAEQVRAKLIQEGFKQPFIKR